MKRLQEETGAKMSILGKGSMRDKGKVRYRLVLKYSCLPAPRYGSNGNTYRNKSAWNSTTEQKNIVSNNIRAVTEMNSTPSRINSFRLTNICRRKWECFSACCLIAYSVIVNYECKVMNLFAKDIYPADLWSPGAELTRACTQTVCWIWCSHS